MPPAESGASSCPWDFLDSGPTAWDHKCKGNHPPLPFPSLHPEILSAGSHHPGPDPLPHPSLTSAAPFPLRRQGTPDPRFPVPHQLRPRSPCTASDPGKSKRCGSQAVAGAGRVGQDAGVGWVEPGPLPFPLGPLCAQSYPSFRRSWSSLAQAWAFIERRAGKRCGLVGGGPIRPRNAPTARKDLTNVLWGKRIRGPWG